ncbi:putative cell division cycle protein [Trypanosoma vivax]|uniref:Putative cell division cycle protein n=1 Tax=Trypanosoma vivax (strain Y486) TaxID=1055687 RepID=G0TRD5_TRYVY|nr:putative cell division cycle protein [Trypanosoma vivax]KAH8612529.1 putative cell division cycle protein [Trypanosoma vivax]CCC46499.1 putative cell division cycle protein [Trypanosoma vivax Y486]
MDPGQLLVISSPLSWWPPASALHEHPLNPLRTFFSAITNTGVALGTENRCVSLSRLGRSVMLSARYICNGNSQSVSVYNPFSGTDIELTLKLSVSTPTFGASTTLHEFVVADQVRVEAAPVCPRIELLELIRLSPKENGDSNMHLNCTESSSNGRDGCHFVLEDRYVPTVLGNIVEQLNASAGLGVYSVLLTGPHGVGKTYTMRRVVMRIPPAISVREVDCLVEHRDINVAALLLLDEREALSTIRASFAPPPTAEHGGTASTVALLLITLDSIELLAGEPSNLLVSIVTYELCAALDRLAQEARCHAVVISTAESTASLSTGLLARLSSRCLHIVHPTPQERLTFIDALCESSDAPMEYTHLRVRERAADLLAGYSAGQLAAMKRETCIQLLRGEATAIAKEEMNRSASGTCVDIDAYRGLVGLSEAIGQVEELVVWPLQQQKLLRRYGIETPKGLVVCGPSGCGKTEFLQRLGRRLRESGIHVVLVDGLSLIEKEVGRTEKNIAALFASARATSPTALFLENIDSLAPPRGRQTTEISIATDRSLSTLLTEMDGISAGSDGSVVVVIASAPSGTAIDPAIGRPGRLDVHITLPFPTTTELQHHIAQGLLERISLCSGETELQRFGSLESSSFITTAVYAHVEKWLNITKCTSVVDANDFVRSVLLDLMMRAVTLQDADSGEGYERIGNRLLEVLGRRVSHLNQQPPPDKLFNYAF